MEDVVGGGEPHGGGVQGKLAVVAERGGADLQLLVSGVRGSFGERSRQCGGLDGGREQQAGGDGAEGGVEGGHAGQGPQAAQRPSCSPSADVSSVG